MYRLFYVPMCRLGAVTDWVRFQETCGASAISLRTVVLLSKAYGRLVLIAFVIATPVSWYAVNQWLGSYSYKANIGIVEYVLAGSLAFVIALVTIGYQSIRAASANPASALRSE